MHYNTRRIIDQVRSNDNQDIQIMFGTTKGLVVPDWQPKPLPIEEFRIIGGCVPSVTFERYLDGIFHDGADLIMEAFQGHDDDGGTCYQAYILKVDWVAHFNKYYLEKYTGSMADSNLQLITMKYLVANPDSHMVIWSGPY